MAQLPNAAFDQPQSDQDPDPCLFVHIDNNETSRDDIPSYPASRTAWITDRCQLGSMEISAFLLFDGFGPDPSLIIQFIGINLIKELFESPKLADIVEQIVEMEKSVEGRGWTSSQHSAIDNQIRLLLRDTFSRADSNAYEAVLERMLAKSGEGTAASDEHLLMASGCSAILALFLGRRLVVANCGNILGVFSKDGSDGLTTIRVSEIHQRTVDSVPFRCFGDFGHKICEQQQHTASSPHPTVQPQIELDYTARFLLFASASVWRLMRCPSNQSLDGAIANFVANAAFRDSEIDRQRQNIHDALWELRARSESVDLADQPLSLALIDLQSPYFSKTDFDRTDGEAEEGPNTDRGREQAAIRSEVDWSEFHTHHLKEEVLAKCASLKQMFQEQQQRTGRGRNLQRISED